MKFSTRHERTHGWQRASLRLLLTTTLVTTMLSSAEAGYREQAKRLHDRLAGVPASEAVLQQMQDAIDPGLPGSANDAAYVAMNNASFYNVTLKNFAAPWTNRDQSVFVPLNDYIATVIGMIRDDRAFNTLLSDNVTYVGRSGVVSAAPSASNNDHYEQLEARNINLSRRTRGRTAIGRSGHSCRSNGRRHDIARRIGGVLHRRHQPRDVPLHADQPSCAPTWNNCMTRACRRIAFARTSAAARAATVACS